MKFRNMIFVLTIAFSAIFASMLGTSYAYYVATEGTTLDITTGNIDTGVAVVFNQSQYINVATGIPISSNVVDALASASVFTLKPNTTILADADVVINISVIDLAISDELRISDFKYKLSCSDGSTSTLLSSGDGTTFTDDVLSNGYLALGTLSTTSTDSGMVLDITKTYTCTLRVWLQETDEDQNDLMNKHFTGLIKVNTLFKTREDVVYE